MNDQNDQADRNDRPSYGEQEHPRYGEDPRGGQAQSQGAYGVTPQGGQGYPPQGGHAPQGGWNQGPYGTGPQDYGQGYPQPGSRYGTMPYEAYGQQRLEEPPKYRTLLTATLVSLALFVVSSLPGFLMVGDAAGFRSMIDESIAQQGQQLSPDELQAIDQVMSMLTGMGIALMAFGTLVGVGLYLLVYFGLRGRKNWARITGIVFAVLALVFTLPSLLALPFLGGSGLLSAVVSVLFVGVNIWWLVLAFNGPISRYLQQRSLMS